MILVGCVRLTIPPPSQNKLQELETQIQATRSRTLSLIKEKDTEIQKLRTELQVSGGRGSLGESPMVTRGRAVSLQSQGSTSSVHEESNGEWTSGVDVCRVSTLSQVVRRMVGGAHSTFP